MFGRTRKKGNGLGLKLAFMRVLFVSVELGFLCLICPTSEIKDTNIVTLFFHPELVVVTTLKPGFFIPSTFAHIIPKPRL